MTAGANLTAASHSDVMLGVLSSMTGDEQVNLGPILVVGTCIAFLVHKDTCCPSTDCRSSDDILLKAFKIAMCIAHTGYMVAFLLLVLAGWFQSSAFHFSVINLII